jgi:glutamate dehydrogenase
MARAALRDDLHAVHAALTAQVIQFTEESEDPKPRIDQWATQDSVVVERVRRTVGEIVESDTFDLARLSVGLRVVRSLVRSDAP